MNVQFAVKDDEVYLIEVNPRASRTVPFVAKAIGRPIAKIAARVMAGEPLADFDADRPRHRPYRGQGSGLPLRALPGHRSGAVTGNEEHRRSHGNRSAISTSPSPSRSSAAGIDAARQRARCSSRSRTPTRTISSRRRRSMVELGFTLIATGGTAAHLEAQGLPVERVNKVAQGRPHIVDRIVDGEVAAGLQHHRGLAVAEGQPVDPRGGAQAQGALFHHRGGQPGRGAGDRGAARPRA